ncbi:MAG: antitoxin MazE-like protein [Bradyrhizobium sp.]
MANSETAARRATRFRERQRAKGLRPATIWIPDIRDPAYRARLDATCRELAALPPAEAEADAAAGLADAFKYTPGWQ